METCYNILKEQNFLDIKLITLVVLCKYNIIYIIQVGISEWII